MRFLLPLLLCAGVPQDAPPAATTPAQAFAAAVVDYRAGRHAEALAGFQALAARDEPPSPELLGNLALAALRVQRTADAEAAARALLLRPDPASRALGEFLVGNAAFQRSERAAAAAALQDAEPMAWASAVQSAEAAFASWCRAAALQDDWPAALRNAERAQRWLGELQRRRAEAERNRPKPKTEPDRPPPPPADPEGPPEEATPEHVRAALPPAEVARLLRRLAEKEREKQLARQAQQRLGAVAGERDW